MLRSPNIGIFNPIILKHSNTVTLQHFSRNYKTIRQCIRKTASKPNSKSMETQHRSLVRSQFRVPGIYPPEYETFLSGNIAKGGVIETISRKAISPLNSQQHPHCSTNSILKNKPIFHSTSGDPISAGIITHHPFSLPIVLSGNKTSRHKGSGSHKRLSRLIPNPVYPKFSLSEQPEYAISITQQFSTDRTLLK